MFMKVYYSEKVFKMEINTPTLKKLIDQPVRYKLKGSTLWNYDIVREVVRKNIIFEGDSRSFSEIAALEKQNI